MTYRGLGHADQHALYLAAMTTGLRAGELAVLTPSRFRLDDSPPVVLLVEGETKNDMAVRQPLPDDAVGTLRAWLAGKPKGRRCGRGLGSRSRRTCCAAT